MKRVLIALWIGVVIAAAAGAHDMFLKLESHYLESGSDVSVALINGTYDKSENVIDRDRMLDVSVVGPESEISSPPAEAWREADLTTWLDLTTGEPGTYVVGVSTSPRTIELSAEDFNEYLEHDGVLDMLEARRAAGTLDRPAAEIYSKHVKAILQVGDRATGAFDHRLGYPIEIVPVTNPAALSVGDRFEFVVLRDGRELADQLVYASYAGFHGHAEGGGHVEAVQVRTDQEGRAAFELTTGGRWYVRLIHMVELAQGDVTHESNWTTLTFEIVE